MTWRDIRREVERRLAAADVESAAAEAGWIVEEVSGFGPGEWLAITDASPSAQAAARVETLVARRVAGEPLQYVLGSWSFRGLDLMVDPRVLIPRPETETVVEVALKEVRSGGAAPRSVADLGTGSGAIAIALAAELVDTEVWATDLSPDALAVARANVAGNALPNVRLAQGDWFDALPAEMRGSFALVVSNPPYVAEHELGELATEVVDHEPRHALIAGPTGLECLERIIGEAVTWLCPDGVLVCEIAPTQASHVVARALEAGFEHAEVHPDLSGRPRALAARVAS